MAQVERQGAVVSRMDQRAAADAGAQAVLQRRDQQAADPPAGRSDGRIQAAKFWFIVVLAEIEEAD